MQDKAGTMSKRWYVVRVQTGRENKVRDGLERRVKESGFADRFGRIVVPTEKISQIREGKRSVRERKIYPGYLMVEMDLDDQTWFLVRETPGLGDFIGADQKPIPMQQYEVDRLLGQESQGKEEAPQIKLDFKVNDMVKIKEGPFQNMDGRVEEIFPQKGLVRVQVAIFGRTTPVELEYWKVEPI